MKNKENDIFSPGLKHRQYGLEIEISDDLSKFRFKGTADIKPSAWKDIRYDSKSVMYFLINRERYYFYEFDLNTNLLIE